MIITSLNFHSLHTIVLFQSFVKEIVFASMCLVRHQWHNSFTYPAIPMLPCHTEESYCCGCHLVNPQIYIYTNIYCYKYPPPVFFITNEKKSLQIIIILIIHQYQPSTKWYDFHLAWEFFTHVDNEKRFHSSTWTTQYRWT
jgi:hypothetical protein